MWLGDKEFWDQPIRRAETFDDWRDWRWVKPMKPLLLSLKSGRPCFFDPSHVIAVMPDPTEDGITIMVLDSGNEFHARGRVEDIARLVWGPLDSSA